MFAEGVNATEGYTKPTPTIRVVVTTINNTQDISNPNNVITMHHVNTYNESYGEYSEHNTKTLNSDLFKMVSSSQILLLFQERPP